MPQTARAQGGILSGGIIVISSSGRPVGGATITVCAFSDNGIPCTQTVSLFSDPGLTISKANPGQTDGNGNFTAFAAPGSYHYTVTGDGVKTTGQPFTTTAVGISNNPVPNLNCNGTFDNTASMTAFFSTLTTSATRIVHTTLPAGTCMVSSNIVLPDYLILTGAGKYATVVKQLSGTNDTTHPIFTFSGSSGGANNGGSHITFSDFTIDGNAAGQSSGRPGSVGNSAGVVSGIYFNNMRFINAWQVGAYFFDFTSTGNNSDIGVWDSDFENNAPTAGSSLFDQQCTGGDFIVFHPLRVRVVNNRSEGTNGDFACTPGGATPNSADVVIASNIVHGARGFGVGLGTFGQNASITGNVFDMATSRQNIIDIGDFGFVTVTGNTVNAGGPSCSVACGSIGDGPPANHVTITGNTFVGQASVNNVCMTLGSSDITITGNVCRASGGSGIVMTIPASTSASNILISGNQVSDSGLAVAGHPGVEIFLNSGAAIGNFTITGNHIFDDQTIKTQAYGIGIAAFGQTTGFNTFLIADNDLRGNATNGLIDNSTPANSGNGVTGNQHVIKNNPGYDLVTDAPIDLLAQGANIGFTQLGAVPSNNVSLYNVCVNETITRAATTSSTLPNVVIAWTDRDSGGSMSTAVIPPAGTASANTTSTQANGCVQINPASSSNIAYSTNSYATSGATSMQYVLRIRAKTFN